MAPMGISGRRGRTLKADVALRVGVLVASTLLVVCVVLAMTFRSVAGSMHEGTAKSIGLALSRTVAEKLESPDRAALGLALARAASDPAVLEVSAYDPRGRLIGTTQRAGAPRGAVALSRALSSSKPILAAREVGGVDALESWTPVTVGGERHGVVAVAVSRVAVDAAVTRVWAISAAVLAVGTLVAVLLSLLIADRLSRPLAALAETSKRLADGDLAVEVTKPSGATMEVESMLDDFAQVIKRFRDLIGEAQRTGGLLGSAAGDILRRAEAEAEAVNAQASSLAETSATLEEFRATTRSIAQQACAVSELATGVQQAVESGQLAVRAAHGSMEAIREGSENAARRAEELSEASARISHVIVTITEIARRTKILAVNAAIEAARAQELGGGFKVVASEVRQLADAVVESTEEIELTMLDLRATVRGIVDATEDELDRVAEGVGEIGQADESMRGIEEAARHAANTAQEISFGTQQQEAGADQAVAAIHEVSEAAQQVSASGRSNREAAENLAGLTDRLVELMGRFRLS